MKSVLISIKPKYPHEDFITVNEGTETAFAFYGGGKVIGEFMCDNIEAYEFGGYEADYLVNHAQIDAMRLNYTDLIKYGKGKTLYGWHISDLVIYDEPKKLSKFMMPCKNGDLPCALCEHYGYATYTVGYTKVPQRITTRACTNWVKKAPQSWCYIEEVEQ